MVENIVIDPGFSGLPRGEKVQNLPASGSSSELSSHQLSQSASSHFTLDTLALYWTLVDQSVIPPGFEDVFVGFLEAWTEAAARDDRRKSLRP